MGKKHISSGKDSGLFQNLAKSLIHRKKRILYSLVEENTKTKQNKTKKKNTRLGTS